MSVQTLNHPLATPRAASPWRRFVPVLPALVLGLLVIGLLFRAEIVAAVGVWYVSTAYSHCFFVIPIAVYLAWDRREAVASVALRPMPWVGVLVLPLGLVWLAVERVGLMEGRQIMVVTMVELLFLAVLGWRMCWALSAALLYLYFLVPFGAFVTPLLQHFTASFIPVGLNLLGIPNYADEYTIDIPAGRFFVAEACAGLRFLIASIAFGALYSALIYRSPWRRAGFMLASIVVPVVANGFRALGIVVLGHVLGSAEAAAADHILYGWIFFSIVILLLVAAGMPFREDIEPRQSVAPPATDDAFRLSRAWPASLGVTAMALVAPGFALWIDHAASASPSLAGLEAPAGCMAVQAPDAGLRRFQCATVDWPAGLQVSVRSFAPAVNPGIIIAAQRDATRENLAEDADASNLQVGGAGSASWRLMATTRPSLMTATLLWLDGAPSGLGLRARVTQARNAMGEARFVPVLVTVGANAATGWTAGADQPAARHAIAVFLQRQAPFLDHVEALATTPRR
jgi:exosortase A